MSKNYNKTMKALKEIIAINISNLRKASGYTQITFSEKINYSNKTVSKWERGESTPDVDTLKQIADMFEVPIQYLFEDHSEEEDDKIIKATSQKPKIQFCINLIAVCSIWILATIIFVYKAVFEKDLEVKYFWPIFVIAIPVSCFVLKILNKMWYKNVTYGLILSSLLIWSLITSIFLTALVLPPYHNLWLLFIVGIPIQVVVILYNVLKYLGRKM